MMRGGNKTTMLLLRQAAALPTIVLSAIGYLTDAKPFISDVHFVKVEFLPFNQSLEFPWSDAQYIQVKPDRELHRSLGAHIFLAIAALF